MQELLNKLVEGLGIEPNKAIAGKEVDLEKLNENPYDGSFEQIYHLVKEGKIAPLTRGGQMVGVSVIAPEGMEDGAANYYYGQALGYVKGTYYPLLAMQLATANLIPQEIVNDKTEDLAVKVLGNKWLNMRGDEIEDPTVEEPEESEPEETLEPEDGEDLVIPCNACDEDDLKKYIRKHYGRCLARGYNLDYYINDDGDYVVENVQWGRKLTQAERDAIELPNY